MFRHISQIRKIKSSLLALKFFFLFVHFKPISIDHPWIILMKQLHPIHEPNFPSTLPFIYPNTMHPSNPPSIPGGVHDGQDVPGRVECGFGGACQLGHMCSHPRLDRGFFFATFHLATSFPQNLHCNISVTTKYLLYSIFHNTIPSLQHNTFSTTTPTITQFLQHSSQEKIILKNLSTPPTTPPKTPSTTPPTTPSTTPSSQHFFYNTLSTTFFSQHLFEAPQSTSSLHHTIRNNPHNTLQQQFSPH